jgi:hypothetical protein
MKRFPLLAVAALALFAVSCAGGERLVPSRTDDLNTLTGTYTAYLYSSKYSESLEGPDLVVGAVVILDREGDGYEFDLLAPEFDYLVLQGVSGKDALDTAGLFFQRFRGRTVTSRIDIEGKTAGYEIRLAHKPWIYRRKSVGAIYHLTEGNRIKVDFPTEIHMPDRH